MPSPPRVAKGGTGRAGSQTCRCWRSWVRAPNCSLRHEVVRQFGDKGISGGPRERYVTHLMPSVCSSMQVRAKHHGEPQGAEQHLVVAILECIVSITQLKA